MKQYEQRTVSERIRMENLFAALEAPSSPPKRTADTRKYKMHFKLRCWRTGNTKSSNTKIIWADTEEDARQQLTLDVGECRIFRIEQI